MVKKLGGYEGKHTFGASLLVCWFGCLIGLPFPFINNFSLAIAVIWISIMFGSIVQSSFTGIVMTLVTAEQRPQAYAMVALCYNLIGYMPAPYLYGLVLEAAPVPEKSKYGMILTFWIQIPACIFCT